MVTHGLMSKCLDEMSATKAVEGIFVRQTSQQAGFLIYKDLFIYLGYFFLVFDSTLILFRNKKKKSGVYRRNGGMGDGIKKGLENFL